ncbi:olfactomedin-4-like isoform X3 [Thalassophryne amazonica]|uniref:olfactomedin-4-like isoform X3 n=1 Tax=Thalassophryne amazonica TaxID=390379 RepID=UPI0014713B5F|nr:olfactomedin-4-like isoform X3 [Thalassophryne amazonica]
MSPSVLLLISTLGPALAWRPLEDLGSGNVTSSAEGQECVCSVFLPDSSFPADRVQNMQQVSSDLKLEVEVQKNKLVHYKAKLDAFIDELQDLSIRVAIVKSNRADYIKLDFELLKVELGQFEALVSQLKESLNSSSPMLDSLYDEIHNMTLTVNQLESFDKSNLEVLHIEFGKLQKKLKDCQKDVGFVKPDIGNCNHTGIMHVSKPMVVQLNAHLDPNYQYGGWGKDSKPVRGQESMYWYGGYKTPAVYEFYIYSNSQKLILRSSFTHHGLPQGYEGIGNNYIIHGNTIYYQAANPFRMTKLNLTSSAYSHRRLAKAMESVSCVHSPNQYLDFSADEKGLWVMYTTEESKGKIVIAKINEKSFDIEDEWSTRAFKRQVGNAFMACGVMYATRPADLTAEEIFYSYDTKTGEEKHLSIPLQKFQENFVNMHYNPTDQKLYMYNNGYYVSYNLQFNRK